MISDEYVKQLFWNGNKRLAGNLDPNEILCNQFFRGVIARNWKNQHPGACMRHMMVFDKFNAIPEFCFSCYKIVIEPRTVIEQFKLMAVFEKLRLPNDNTRKCMVECREEVSGSYKGLIYCGNMKEAEEIKDFIKTIISEEISKKIPITLKRGCSEYAIAYPDYANVSQETTAMEYKRTWKKYEDIVDSDFVVKTQIAKTATHNQPSYTLRDAKVMLAWLKYAATIGDLSYLKITGERLEPWDNIKRPHPFQAPEEN